MYMIFDFVLCAATVFESSHTMMWLNIWLHIKIFNIFLIFLWLVLPSLLETGLYCLCPMTVENLYYFLRVTSWILH